MVHSSHRLFITVLAILTIQPGNAAPARFQADLKPQGQAADTASVQKARAAVRRGRELLAKNTREAMEEALAHFEQAVVFDPSYAPAYVGLADSYTLLWSFGFASRAEALPRAEKAARKALALDEQLPEAHTALAVVRLRDWDWQGAEREFQRALELNPEDAQSHHWYALFLSAMGRHQEALDHSHRAVAIAPSPSMDVGLSAMYYFARDYRAMIDLLQRTLGQHPDFAYAYDWIGMAYVQERQFEEAFEAYREALDRSGHSAEVLAGYGHAYGVAGKHEEARAALEELHQLAEKQYVPSVQIAFVYTSLGEREKALAMLERAYRERSWELVFIQVEPWLDPLRSDPRFQHLVERMNFPR